VVVLPVAPAGVVVAVGFVGLSVAGPAELALVAGFVEFVVVGLL